MRAGAGGRSRVPLQLCARRATWRRSSLGPPRGGALRGSGGLHHACRWEAALRDLLFPRPPEGPGCQHSTGDGSQNSAIDQSFWETFGSAEPAQPRKAPSSDGRACTKAADSWDAPGSGSASHKNSGASDVGEAWGGGGEGRATATGRAARPAAQVDEGWDSQDW